MSKPNHGPQFDADRHAAGTTDEAIRKHYADAFDPRNIIGLEDGDVHDTYQEDKELRYVLDYAGIDYVIDEFDRVVGINHRENQPGKQRRFDVRASTGTDASSTLDKIVSGIDAGHLVPRYASRLKRDSDGGVAWVRIVDLEPLAGAIREADLEPHARWTGDDGTEAWLFEYDLLRKMGAVVYDSETER